jgi:pantoate--beta-alanine ligase
MEIVREPAAMRAASRRARSRGLLGFVPTMGALHEGHLSLVRRARELCPAVAVSIFVNPLQFGPSEDFTRYPRTFERDCELLEKEGVDMLFAPAVETIYPVGETTYVVVEGLREKLCGHSRPGHFRGVATVVAKLFHIVEPQVAVFGQKDAAQCAVIRRMVRDLDFDVRIEVGPIVREADGLAMSSRNAYLSPEERRASTVLYRSLCRVQTLADKGEGATEKLIAAGKSVMAKEPAARMDYFEVVDPDSLDPLPDISRGALVAVAAFLGGTRLIDNIVLPPR